MIKYNYIIIQYQCLHLTRVFTSIAAFKKVFKYFAKDIKELEKELLRVKTLDYEKNFDTYISFQAKSGFKYDLRIIKKEVNKY
jgi:hypothetical protein